MLTISSFNIKNNYSQYTKEKANQIITYLLDNKIDVLSLQELFLLCEKDLVPFLHKHKYQLYGDYRFKWKLLDPMNEKTPIITNKKVRSNQTTHLPFFPSPIKRIATKVEIEDQELGLITIINTHLDYKFNFVKKRQLKTLLKLIEKEKNPLIITGDFNLKNNKEIFNDFIHSLEKLHIKRVELNDKTLKQSKYHRAIDHIFISETFKVISKEIKKDLPISDHYPLLITITKKN